MEEMVLASAIGPSTHNLDSDDRLIIPKRMRDLLGKSFVLTRGIEKCLWAMPETLYNSMTQGLAGDLAFLDANNRRLAWRFIGHAVRVTVDNQFRLVLPEELRESAGIDRHRAVTVMAMANHVQIWDRELWKQQDETLDDNRVQEALNVRFNLSQAKEVVDEGARPAVVESE